MSCNYWFISGVCDNPPTDLGPLRPEVTSLVLNLTNTFTLLPTPAFITEGFYIQLKGLSLVVQSLGGPG